MKTKVYKEELSWCKYLTLDLMYDNLAFELVICQIYNFNYINTHQAGRIPEVLYH